MTALPHDLQPSVLDKPFLTDVGLHEWTVAKWSAIPSFRNGTPTAVFWRGGRECMWIPASPRGVAPREQLLHRYYTPEEAERDFLAVYPEETPA